MEDDEDICSRASQGTFGVYAAGTGAEGFRPPQGSPGRAVCPRSRKAGHMRSERAVMLCRCIYLRLPRSFMTVSATVPRRAGLCPATLGKGLSVATGTVRWFNAGKGFGFITPDDGSADVFVHYSAIVSGGYRLLEENQRVQFLVVQGPKGPQAENVQPL